MRGSVERRQQTVFFALASGIRLGVPVLGEQTRFTDIPFVLHPREASRFVSRDADILYYAPLAIAGIVAMYGLDFEVAVSAALAADEPAAQHALMHTAPNDRMEQGKIVFLRTNDIDPYAQGSKTRDRCRVDPLDVFGYFAADVASVVEHHLREHSSIQWLAVFEGKEDRSDRILAERTRSDIDGVVISDVPTSVSVIRRNPLLLPAAGDFRGGDGAVEPMDRPAVPGGEALDLLVREHR